MQILVIGNLGLIGSAICKRHLEAGDKVFGIDTKVNSYINYKNIEGVEQLHPGTDISWFLKFNDAIVSNQASLVSVPQSLEQPYKYLTENVKVVAEIIEACKNSGRYVKIIHSGSMSIFGEPTLVPTPETHALNPCNIYGASKLMQHETLKVATKLYDIDVTVLNYWTVHGRELVDTPNTGVLNFMRKQVLETGTITINGDGNQYRDIIDVTDVAEAHLKASRSVLGAFQAINIGTGVAHKLKDIAALMGAKVVCNGIVRPGDIYASRADITVARTLLNWEPKVTLDQMIKEYK